MTDPRTPADPGAGERFPDAGQDPEQMIAAGYARGVWGTDADELASRMEAGEDPAAVLDSVPQTWVWVGDHARVLSGDYGLPDDRQPALPGAYADPWRDLAARDAIQAAKDRAADHGYASPEPVRDDDYARPGVGDGRGDEDRATGDRDLTYAEYELTEPERDEPGPVHDERTW